MQVGLAGEELALDGVRLEHVDQRQHLFHFRPGFVREPSLRCADAHEALHVEADAAGFGAHRFDDGERHFAADRGTDQDRLGGDRVEIGGHERVGDGRDGEDALVDVVGRILQAHQRRVRGVANDDFDADAAQQVGRLAIFRGEPRDRADAEVREPRGVRGVAVAAAVDVARAGRRDDRVLGVGADGDEIESRCHENLLNRAA